MTGDNTILITGGFGNLGSRLVQFFIEKDFDVTVLCRKKKDFIKGDFKVIECDITREKECESVLASMDFSYVIHAASANDVFVDDYAQRALLVNALGTRNLLQAIRKSRLLNFIYLSTFHVYGTDQGTIDENRFPNPKTDYATSHLFGEYYVKQFHNSASLPFTILRLTNSYGCPLEANSSKWYLLFNDLAKMAWEHGVIELRSNGRPQRDFIWMRDVCNTIASIASLRSAPNETYNLGSGISLELIDVAREVQKAYHDTYGKMVPIKVNELDQNQYDNKLVVDISKLQKLVPLTFQSKLYDEAKKIFNLMEDLNG